MNVSPPNQTYGDRALKAKGYFEQGYSCAQAVAIAFSDLTGISQEASAKLASSFGGGMGRLREVCGAVSGMFLVLSALYGISDPQDSAGKAAQYAVIQNLARRFREQNGSIVCRELLGLSEKTSAPTPEQRSTHYYRKRPCGDLVACATQILEAYVEKKENEAKK